MYCFHLLIQFDFGFRLCCVRYLKMVSRVDIVMTSPLQIYQRVSLCMPSKPCPHQVRTAAPRNLSLPTHS